MARDQAATQTEGRLPVTAAGGWCNTRPPPLEWVLPGLLRGSLGVITGTGGVGKSWLVLQTACAVALGHDPWGVWRGEWPAGPAVILALEDPEIILHTRIHRLAENKPESRPGWDQVFVASGHGRRVALIDPGPGGGYTEGSGVTMLQEVINEIKPRIVFIDTLNRALGYGLESDASAAGLVTAALERLAREYNTSIILVHHQSKAATAAGQGDAHTARGSSVWSDNARWVRALVKPQSTKDNPIPDYVVDLHASKTSYSKSEEKIRLRRLEGGGVVPYSENEQETNTVKKSAPGWWKK